MADNCSTQTQAPSNVVIVTGGGNGAFARIYQQQLAVQFSESVLQTSALIQYVSFWVRKKTNWMYRFECWNYYVPSNIINFYGHLTPLLSLPWHITTHNEAIAQACPQTASWTQWFLSPWPLQCTMTGWMSIDTRDGKFMLIWISSNLLNRITREKGCAD